LHRGRDFGRGPKALVPSVGVSLLQQREIKGEQQPERALVWGTHSPCYTHRPEDVRTAVELLGDESVCCAETCGKLAGRRS